MRIKLNGKEEVVAAKTIAELAAAKNINCARVVIEHNLNIVDKDKLGEVVLRENDVVEILSFIGGG